jgi:conjugal transfer pilus assembly protein TraK
VLECDRDKGEIYVRPVGDSAKPINLFVSSAQATYTLLLRRSDTPADTIVIRDRTPKALKHAGRPQAGRTVTQPGPRHEGAAGGDGFGPGAARHPGRRDPADPLWAEARFSLVRQYEGRGLVGEKYLLQNVSDAPMVLAEQEFDRDSKAGGRSSASPSSTTTCAPARAPASS